MPLYAAIGEGPNLSGWDDRLAYYLRTKSRLMDPIFYGNSRRRRHRQNRSFAIEETMNNVIYSTLDNMHAIIFARETFAEYGESQATGDTK